MLVTKNRKFPARVRKLILLFLKKISVIVFGPSLAIYYVLQQSWIFSTYFATVFGVYFAVVGENNKK